MQVGQTDKETLKRKNYLQKKTNVNMHNLHFMRMKLHQTCSCRRNRTEIQKASKVETETKPSTLEKQLENLEEKCLSEGLESASLKSQTSVVKLPKLDFEKYSGDALRYQEFWDSFSSSVQENKQLHSVEKLNYLRAKLEGNAKRTIAGLKITNDNY